MNNQQRNQRHNLSAQHILIRFFFGLIFLAGAGTGAFAQSGGQATEPWTQAQLLPPAELAGTLETGARASQPLLLSVGPAAMIKGSVDIGPASDTAHLAKLKAALQKQPRDRAIVIYCGCCPLTHCPNVRPAFSLLKEMHFTNIRLLDLEHNIRTDWMAKGYPSED